MVDFDVRGAKSAGWSDREIAEYLAKQQPDFDIAAARNSGYNDADLVDYLSSGNTPSPEGGQQARANRIASNERIKDSLTTAVDDMSTGQQVLAGIGKSFVDTGRGINQAVTFDDAKEAANTAAIDSSRERDRPLSQSTGGNTGQVVGGIAQTIPAALIPGAGGVIGSATIGGLYGASQPVGSQEGEARWKNTAAGAVAGAVPVIGARTIGAMYRGGKALVEPFTDAGRMRIAGRTMERFGVQPQDVAGLSNAPTRTGAVLTLPEQITRPEGAAAAARLKDTVGTTEAGAQFAARDMSNNAARVATLKKNAAPRDAAADARTQQAGTLYKQAYNEVIDPASLSPKDSQEFAQLMQRPAIQRAAGEAATNLQNSGSNLPPNSVGALHQMKLALDDAIARASGGAQTAASVNEAHALRQSRDALVGFIEKHNPTYAQARKLYRDLSVPVNQADIAGEVLSRGSSNTTDLSGNNRLLPNALTGAVDDEARLIKQATGRGDVGSKLADVLEPEQLADIKAVVGEVDRAGAVTSTGNGPGAGTAQRIAGQNIVSEMARGANIPASVATSTIVEQALARPLGWLLKGPASEKINATLAQVILNPSLASRAMAAANPAQRTALARLLSDQTLLGAATQQAAKQALPATITAVRQ